MVGMGWLVVVTGLEAFLTGVLALVSLRVFKHLMVVKAIRLFTLAFSILAIANLSKTLFNAANVLHLIPVSSVLETVGFFFLALAYVYSVKKEYKGLALGLVPYASSPLYVFSKGVSLYLILYSAIEITLFFIETRSRSTILVSTGLYLLFVAQAVSAFTSLGITNPLAGEVVSLAGYAFLSVPGLLAYARGAGRVERV